MPNWKSAFAAALLLSGAATHAGCAGAIEPPFGSDPADRPPRSDADDDDEAGDDDVGDDDVGDDDAGDDDTDVKGGGTGSTPPPADMGTKVLEMCTDGKEAPSPRLLRLMTRRELSNTLQDLLYATAKPDTSTLPGEPRVKSEGFNNNAGKLVVEDVYADELLTITEPFVEQAVKEKKSQLVTCATTDAACQKTFIEKFGTRAFRRPVTPEEVTRYQKFFADELTGKSFDEGVKLVIRAMIASPNFLYRSEVGEKQSNGTYKLNAYEVASALSYLYLGTMPDQMLFDAAAKNALGTKAEVETHVRRLLKDPRAADQVNDFFTNWLRTDLMQNANKDKMTYPTFDDTIRLAMFEEQKRFVTDIALTRDGKFEELYTADYVMANAGLSKFYGLSGGGNDFQKVMAAPTTDRGGLLGLGTVLGAHASSMDSSPIKRGVFVRDRLLCQHLPPPPEELDTTPPGLDPKLTTRERFRKHTESASCASCHQFIDGVGFGLEGFDGVGQKRTQENNLPVDDSGEVIGVEERTPDAPKVAFKGQRELAKVIADSESGKACMTLQYYRYGRGYVEAETDACSISKLHDAFTESELTVKELLVNLALLDSFTLRAE